MNDIRIIQVDDNCSFVYFRPHTLTVDDIEFIVGRYPRGAADVIVNEMANVDRTSFKSEVNSTYPQRGVIESDDVDYPQRNTWALIDAGIHLPAAVCDAVHKRGFQFWPGMRSNTSKWSTDLKEQHPEWLLPAVNYTRPGLFNYEVPQVRQRVLAQMRELVTTCDADGFYFNLMRCFFSFHPDRAARCADLMTGWFGEIRAMLDEVGEQKGKRLPLAVQVQARVQDNTYQGHDVRAWAKEGFIDYLCPARDNHIDFNLPMEQWLEVVDGTDCKFFPCVQPGLGYVNPHPGPDHYRALFNNYHRGGAHGLSTMNVLYRPEVYPVFEEYRDPQKLTQQRRHYHFSGPPISSNDGDLAYPLQPGLMPIDFEFVVREEPPVLQNATLHFTLDDVHNDDELTYALNGEPIPDYIEYDGYSKHPYRQTVGEVLVQSKNVHRMHYTVPLKGLTMHNGFNRLRLGTGLRPPGVSGPVIVRSIEVVVD